MRATHCILVLLSASFISLLALAIFHDDGIPDSLTKSEKEYTVETWLTSENVAKQIAVKVEQFCHEPENEAELLVELTALVNQWWDLMDLVRNDPVFSGPTAEGNAIAQRVISEFDSMENAVEAFTNEIKKRRNEKSFSPDAYAPLKKALVRQLHVEPDAHCVQSECSLCTMRKSLINFCQRFVKSSE